LREKGGDEWRKKKMGGKKRKNHRTHKKLSRQKGSCAAPATSPRGNEERELVGRIGTQGRKPLGRE